MLTKSFHFILSLTLLMNGQSRQKLEKIKNIQKINTIILNSKHDMKTAGHIRTYKSNTNKTFFSLYIYFHILLIRFGLCKYHIVLFSYIPLTKVNIKKLNFCDIKEIIKISFSANVIDFVFVVKK